MTPLHHFGNFIRDIVIAIPMPVARSLFVIFFILLIIWVIRLPKNRYSPPENEVSHTLKSSNLKLWALIALGLQLAIYLIF